MASDFSELGSPVAGEEESSAMGVSWVKAFGDEELMSSPNLDFCPRNQTPN